MAMPDCIDLSGNKYKYVARQTLEGMSVVQRTNQLAVDDQIEKTSKTIINREFKGTILNVAHSEQLELLNIEHLTKSASEP
jgi:hypothetical protein